MAGIDVTTASMARTYDYWRGGKEHFAADRAQAAAVEALYPPGCGPRELTARNRAWLERAVSSAVHDGITQVLSLGSGFVTGHGGARELHEVALAARDTARVAYVDEDPVVVRHSTALTGPVPGVAFACGDLRRPGEVLADPDVRSVIDPGRPAAVVLGLVLHFTPAAEARRVIEGWARWLRPGSRFLATVAHWDDPGVFERTRAVYGPASLHNHTEDQVAGMMRGLDLLGGGIERARGWGPEPLDAGGPACILAGAGRKP